MIEEGVFWEDGQVSGPIRHSNNFKRGSMFNEKADKQGA